MTDYKAYEIAYNLIRDLWIGPFSSPIFSTEEATLRSLAHRIIDEAVETGELEWISERNDDLSQKKAAS